MGDASTTEIFKNGLWHNNAGLVQLLGLCPLLAVSTTTVNGLGLGLASTATLIISNVIVSLIRNLIRQEVRIPVFVLVIASTVTVIDLTLNAWFHELHHILGIFIPLIVTNCVIIGRAESFAAKQPVLPAFYDGLAIGLGFTLILAALGTLRELLGRGTIFAQAQLLFGDAAQALQVTVFDHYGGFLLAILPPGAFIGLGLLIAIKNIIDARAAKRAARKPATAPATEGATAH